MIIPDVFFLSYVIADKRWHEKLIYKSGQWYRNIKIDGMSVYSEDEPVDIVTAAACYNWGKTSNDVEIIC
jgi:hypothetical protein